MSIRHGSLKRGRALSLRCAAAAAGAAILLSGHPTLAQAQLEEIVVTARKTEENLRDIPLQVTALTLNDILKTNMTTPRDLNSMSPGLNWQSQTGGRIGPGRLFFRGLAAGARGDSKGSIFLDGNYLASSGWDIPFHYFERIEVMPGPQSAQFGRATFGGGINYVTRDPKEEFEFIGNFNAMTLGQYEADLFYGGRVSDKFLASIFANYQVYDGPDAWAGPPDVLHPDGVEVQGTSTLSGAVKLIFEPSDDLRLKAHVLHTYDHDDPVLVPWPLDSEKNALITKPNGQVIKYVKGNNFHIETYPGGFPYMAFNWHNIPDPDRRQESWRTSFDASWDVSDHNVSFQYYNEYEWSKAGGQDVDFGHFPAFHTSPQKTTVSGNSAELRITSSQDQPFRYAVGGYYLRLITYVQSTTFFSFVCQTLCEATGPQALFNPVAAFNPVTQSIAGFTGRVTRSTTPPVVTDRRDKVRDLSAFVALYYDFADQFTFSFEGRYQSELIATRSFVPGGFTSDNTYKAFVPRVTLDYRYSDDGHVYALFSIGNNPGGFNTSIFVGQPGSGTTAADRFVPEEELYNYELGAKSLWLDGRLSTDLAVYHMDWKNQIQTVTFLQPGSTTATYAILSGAGTSKVDELGLSAALALSEELTVNGNLSYNRAVYKQFCSTALFQLLGTASPGRIGCVDINGNKVETVPAWINSLTVTYEAPLTGDWTWAFNGSYQYQSGMWESDMNFAKNEPQNLFHFSLGVKQGEFSFDVYCTNCTQEETPYRFVRSPDARHGPNVTTGVSATATPRRPRQWGLKTAYRF